MTVDTEITPAAPSGIQSPSLPGGPSGPADGQRRPPRRKGEGYGRKYTPRRKVCQFCADKISYVDFKDLSRKNLNPLKKGVFRSLKVVRPLKHMALTFAPATIFICVK